jgi:nucleotide-binding universal stress UspA family protein
MMTAKASRFEPKKILCAVDMSPMSPTVLHWARLFVEAYQARLDVVHAEWSDYPPYFLPSQEEELAARSQQRRAALTQDLARLAWDALGEGLAPEIAVLEGHPVEVILARVASVKSDLIVMGSHGRSGISRLRLGSIAENVIRTTSTPTLVARARADQGRTPKISRVLCPVSLTEAAHQCLKLSAEIVGAFRAQLVVVHAVEEGTFDLNSRHQDLCQWVPSEVRNQCDLVEVVRHGNAAEQILLTARDRAVDLIILGSGRRPFLEFIILGTTAERVIRHADSAVLVVS